MKRISLAALLFLQAAKPAHAHTPVPGIEGFYIGLIDPFLAAPQALVLLTVGLLISSFGKGGAVWPLATFCAATLLGIIFGAVLLRFDAVLLMIAVVAGAAAALAPARFVPLCLLLAAVGGFYVGAVSIPDPGPVRDRIITVAGSFVGANLAVLYLFGAVLYAKENLNAAWLPVALRSVGGVAAIVAAVLLALHMMAGN